MRVIAPEMIVTIGRPPIVREAVLACLQRLKRARVARLIEETGLGERSVYVALERLLEDGAVSRYRAEGHGRPFYMWEVRGE